MSTRREAKEEIGRIFDAAKIAAQSYIDRAWPEKSSKRIHFVLVAFNDEELYPGYLGALRVMPAALNEWLGRWRLKLVDCVVHVAHLPGSPKNYNWWALVEALKDKGLLRLDGENAWYLFLQDSSLELKLAGTVGGDVFGQKGGQEGERVPGVSAFMITGLHALAYNEAHPNDQGQWTRNKALGCIMHELGHNLALLPCAWAPHGERCVMKPALYDFPDCELECHDRGVIWNPDPPGWQRGNEGDAFVKYGFAERV